VRYRTLLIDDEPLALQRLERLLEPHAEAVAIVERASSGPEAAEKIDALEPDLIFLDIQMPELDGFGVLGRIQHQPLVIFCTAYDEYALRAFETNSVDYLLKPVDPERLEKALAKLQRLTREDAGALRGQIRNLLAGLSTPGPKRIQVRVGDRILFVNVADICFFRAVDKYVELHTFGESFLLSESLNQLESRLPAEDFVRTHRSVLLNMNHLDEIVRWFAGTCRARMRDKNRTELPVSRSARSRLGLS
jgi:two-component system LytT family response regulator